MFFEQTLDLVHSDNLALRDVRQTSIDARQFIRRLWGKGFNKAALNFGDCFAYDVAREHGCPLLYVGNDFAQTDVEAAV